MKRIFGFLTVAAFIAAVGVSSAFATSPGSGSIEVSPDHNGLISVFTVTTSGGPNPVTMGAGMTVDVSISSGSGLALLVTGSLESFLSTDTTVSGNTSGTKQTSTAEGDVTVVPALSSPACDKVVTGVGGDTVANCADNICDTLAANPNATSTTVDGQKINFFNIQPRLVTFNERLQQLSALLGQVCTETNSTVTCTGQETIELLLSTMTANSYQFAADGLSSGVYEVTLCIGAEASANVSGTNTIGAGATAKVGVGPGTLSAVIVKAETPNDCLDLTGKGGGACTSFSF